MDTVRVEIALQKHSPYTKTPSPVSRTLAVPAPSVTPEVKNTQSSVSCTVPTKKGTAEAFKIASVSPQRSLGDRFHDWMEMDFEHGL